eukprot:3383186-Prymnesium_polylepis.2
MPSAHLQYGCPAALPGKVWGFGVPTRLRARRAHRRHVSAHEDKSGSAAVHAAARGLRVGARTHEARHQRHHRRL